MVKTSDFKKYEGMPIEAFAGIPRTSNYLEMSNNFNWILSKNKTEFLKSPDGI